MRYLTLTETAALSGFLGTMGYAIQGRPGLVAGLLLAAVIIGQAIWRASRKRPDRGEPG